MKKTPSIIFISSILAIYLSFALFIIFGNGSVALPNIADSQAVEVSQGELIRNGESSEISLPGYFDVLGETKLCFNLNYAFSGKTVPSLILQANHTFMEISLDGETIYKVTPQPYSIGNYFTNIPLPQTANGAKLEISVTVPKNGITHVSMPALIVSNEAVFLKRELLHDLPSLLLNAMILFSGVLLLALGLMTRKSINPYKMVLRGILAINCGIYFMCETYCLVYLATNSRLVYLLDMVSFAMLGPTIIVLLGWELNDWRGKLLKSVAAIGMASAIAQLAAFIFGGIELRRLLPITHAIQIVGILAIIASIIYGFVCKKSNKGLYIGGLIALGGAVDIIAFSLELNEHNVFFMKIGLIIYLLHQMYIFIRLLMQRSAEEAREHYYKTLAMQDPLTNCYSRSAFELERDSWKGKTVRTVFFLDLNNLKETNDQHGHLAGDRLIRAFGEVLNRVFFSFGKCYRAGGDEFWIFCDDLPAGMAVELMHSVQKATTAYNKDSILPATLSYAIGVCDTAETHGDLNRAIEIADANMYENKHEIKSLLKH